LPKLLPLIASGGHVSGAENQNQAWNGLPRRSANWGASAAAARRPGCQVGRSDDRRFPECDYERHLDPTWNGGSARRAQRLGNRGGARSDRGGTGWVARRPCRRARALNASDLNQPRCTPIFDRPSCR